ncbi:MAG: hypothetical protein OSJ28_09425 [Desulfovibrio sp.]|nr:hypothetical protein [Desulfovibrio sp.]
MAGCIFLLLAASMSEALAGYPLFALFLLFILSWLTALPKKTARLSWLCRQMRSHGSIAELF